MLEHVAQAGFDPGAHERARGRVAGLVWQGRVLAGRDMLTPVEVHYVWHVLKREEWPAGTTLGQYVQSIRDVVLDPDSGVFTHRYGTEWQLGVVRESRNLRGPRGADWV